MSTDLSAASTASTEAMSQDHRGLERRAMLGAMGIVGVGALAALAKAGPINPPAGPVGPTNHTLDEVYNKIPGVNGTGDGRIPIPGGTASVNITQPGSYLLTGNITVAGGAISISAADVTLDLNGFTVTATSPTSGFPIFINSAGRITVRNGIVVGGQWGISLGAATPTDVIVEDVIVRNARLRGISLSVGGTDRLAVRRCSVYGTGSTTTSADASQQIVGILVSGNNARVEDCSVCGLVSNAASPSFSGIQAGSTGGAIVSRCSVSNATMLAGIGIFLFGTAVYRDNTVLNFVTGYTGGTNGGGNV